MQRLHKPPQAGSTPAPATIWRVQLRGSEHRAVAPKVAGSKPVTRPYGLLAQLVERQTEDLRVPGSIPGEPTIYGRMPESGQLERSVKPLPQGCVGSNPTSPTIIGLLL